jgi:hypothetical protein
MLEGGYNLNALKECAYITVKNMLEVWINTKFYQDLKS